MRTIEILERDEVILSFNYAAEGAAMTFVGNNSYTNQNGKSTTVDTWDLNLAQLAGTRTIGGYVLYTDVASNQGAPNDPYFLISTPGNVVTPEPSTLVLLCSSLLGFAGLARLRRK